MPEKLYIQSAYLHLKKGTKAINLPQNFWPKIISGKEAHIRLLVELGKLFGAIFAYVLKN